MKKINTDGFNTDAQVVCACGATFTTGSVKKTIQVDICSKCHPFYTGEMKYVDTQGRVEKFVTRRDKAAQISQKTKKARAKNQSSQEQKTLKQMLQKKS